jgi:excisionase family DNA binding protein
MKIVYIAEKEELEELVRESVRQEIESLMKTLNQKSTPERLTLAEAAQYLGIKRATMYGRTSARKIPFYKLGRNIFFYKKELDDWIGNTSHRYRTMDDLASEQLAKMAQRKRRY